MKRYNLLSLLVILSVIFIVFRKWFIFPEIIGGDWPYYYENSLKNFSLVPMIWHPWLGNGLGALQPLLGLQLFVSTLIVPFTQWINIPWNIVYKVCWFGLFLILSFFSPIFLWRSVFSRTSSSWPVFLAGLIYSTNTYSLMVTGGGQMGVAIAYGTAPLVLASFIKLIKLIGDAEVYVKSQKSKVKSLLIAGLLLGFQLMIDPRIAYVTMVGAGIYYILKFKVQSLKFKVVAIMVIPIAVAAFLNAFWLVPMIVIHNNPLENLGPAHTSIESLRFFSFADFSHTLSLLHPNWPENIFGKTYFLQPEFLLIPILAFASLVFIGQRTTSKKHEITNIRFFVLLATLGAFLSKGAQEPFGSLYQWLFTHVPGFVMFRDPTKFYLLTASGFSVLIPFVISRFKRYGFPLSLIFVIFWLITIRQAVLGQLGGTFARHAAPIEYKQLQIFLDSQKGFSRTLWVPRQSRFTYASLDHLSTEAEPLFSATNPGQLREKLELYASQKLLSDIGVGYVMIPYDSLGELFLIDRKYDVQLRKEYEAILDGIPWLTKINSANIPIYRTAKHKDLFSLSNGGAVTYRRLLSDQYEVSFIISAPSELYYSQSYNPGWVFVVNGSRVTAQKSDTGLSFFTIASPGVYHGKIIFDPQKYVTWWSIFSVVTLLGITCIIVLL